MTLARIQPFFKANKFNLGYFDGVRVFQVLVTERTKAFCLFNRPFCLIWISQGVSSNKAIQQVEVNFKMIDFYLTDENVNCHFEYIYKLKIIEPQLINSFVYDLESENTDRVRS